LRIRRHAERAENNRLFIPMPPIPRCNECARLNASFGLARHNFISIVVVRVADERQRPSRSHHPGANVLALYEAFSQRAPISVGANKVALPGPAGGIFDQFITRGDAAGPALTLGIKAYLISFWRVDASEADLVAPIWTVSPSTMRGSAEITSAPRALVPTFLGT
jgi:hypothetical protein